MAKRKMKHPTPGDVLVIIWIAALMGSVRIQTPSWHRGHASGKLFSSF